MEDKLGAILNNPQLMQQIMSMAGSLSGQQAEKEPAIPTNPLTDFDPEILQKMMSLAGNLNINDHQRTLLLALKPYLTEERIRKLEKAMRAAKLANAASSILSSGGRYFLTGR